MLANRPAARHLTILLLVLLGTGPAAADPALWLLRDDDTIVHLLGTIHLLPEDTPWYGDDLRSLVARADSLTVEVAADRVDPMSLQQSMAELGFYPPGDTLSAHLPEDLHTEIMAMAQKAGLPTQAIERMKPWLVGLTLTNTLAAKAGYVAQNGVEITLLDEARAAGTPVRELETVIDQLQIFAGLPEEAQITWLRDGMDELADLESYVGRLKDAWLAGDLDTIDRMLTEGFESSPELAEALLYERNAKWVPQVEALLDEPGEHLLAVGAGHLIGEDSLVDLLREKGYAVQLVSADDTAAEKSGAE